MSGAPTISHGANGAPTSEPPLPARVSPNRQWTISAYPLDVAAAKALWDSPAIPETGFKSTGWTTIVKGDRYYTVRSAALDGKETWIETDTWVAGQLSVSKKNDGSIREEVAWQDEGSGETFGFDFSQSDFPELRWATPERSVGPVNPDDRSALWRFEDRASGSVLWMDAKQRLPVARVSQGILYKYDFRAAAAPQMPDAILDRFREWHRGRTFLNKN